jgi:phosphate transport system substrate-binding protein
MDGLEPFDFPQAVEINPMYGVFVRILNDEDGIGYTFNNYAEVIARRPDIPQIAINGIFPDENTVKNNTYPFISKIHVAIRSDLDRNSMAYKLYEWLQSKEARPTITECGFIPK